VRDTLLATLIHKHSPSFKQSGTVAGRTRGGWLCLSGIISHPMLPPWATATPILRRHTAMVAADCSWLFGRHVDSVFCSPTVLALNNLAADAECYIKPGQAASRSPCAMRTSTRMS
jgi:hypothetical protein